MKKRADAYFGPLYIPELPGGFFLGAGRAEWGGQNRMTIGVQEILNFAISISLIHHFLYLHKRCKYLFSC